MLDWSVDITKFSLSKSTQNLLEVNCTYEYNTQPHNFSLYMLKIANRF